MSGIVWFGVPKKIAFVDFQRLASPHFGNSALSNPVASISNPVASFFNGPTFSLKNPNDSAFLTHLRPYSVQPVGIAADSQNKELTNVVPSVI
jgi:hypothetical protein